MSGRQTSPSPPCGRRLDLGRAPMQTLMVALLAFFALTSVAAAAPSRDCLSQAQTGKVHPGKSLKYRQVGSVRCWFAGRTPDKSEFKIARASAERRATRAAASGTQR